MSPKISLIIPTRNEEALLPRLLKSVNVARGRYRHGPGEIEVIVVDNDSEDCTAELAQAARAVVVHESKRVIGAVRNAGARAARAPWLAFVDADMVLHPDTFNAIECKLEDKCFVAGATGVTMERWSLGIAITYAISALIIWIVKIDTGVVFCRHQDFDAVGGYDEKKRVAEDVDFLIRLKKLGRKRKQRLTRATQVKAIASTRKFDIHGEWYYFELILRFFWGVLRGKDGCVDVEDKYWYGR